MNSYDRIRELAVVSIGRACLFGLLAIITFMFALLAWPGLALRSGAILFLVTAAILMLKASALASVITLFDLMGVTRAIFARHFALEMFVYAAVLYLALTLLISRASALVEARLNPQRAREA